MTGAKYYTFLIGEIFCLCKEYLLAEYTKNSPKFITFVSLILMWDYIRGMLPLHQNAVHRIQKRM
jgi:hypothetical protein